MKVKARFIVTFLIFSLSLIRYAPAQICPPDDGFLSPGKPTTLLGTIRYHNELRGWIGLKLKQPLCGSREIQLTFLRGEASLHYRQTKAQNDCVATVTGQIERSVTAYYSATFYIADGNIKPDAYCHPEATPPDLSKVPIPKEVNSYKAEVTVDLSTNKPMVARAWKGSSPQNNLTPWQSFIDAELNGNNSIWVSCRDGFEVKDAFTRIDHKTRKAEDFLTPRTPGLVPSETGPSSITITCVRSSNQPAPATSNK